MRRPQPRYAAALLVDQNRGVGAADAIAQRTNQLANLVGRAAIAPEENEPDRIGGGKEIAFEGTEALTQAA